MRFSQEETPPRLRRDERSDAPQAARELDELGRRLHREAARLATRYPATCQRVVAAGAAKRPRVGTVIAAAVTVAATLVIAAAPMLSDGWIHQAVPDRWMSRSSSPRVRLEMPETLRRASEPATGELVNFPPSAAAPPMDARAEFDASSFLLEVSDPELEALLDLWEEERSEPTRLSI